MKHSKIRKLLALLLVLMLATTMLAGCGDDDDDDDDDDRKSSQSDDKKGKGNSTIAEPTGKLEDGDPENAALRSGDYLYKALPNANLNGITSQLPKAVTVVVLTDTGSNVNMTMNESTIKKLVQAFTEVKIGQYVGDTKETKFNTITFRWEDESETEIGFYGTKLVYKANGAKQVYELDGGAQLWTAATNLNSGGDETDDYEEVVCKEQKFKTKAMDGYPFAFEEGSGLYIGTSPDYSASSIPYVLINRWGDLGVSVKDYLSKVATPAFRSDYGDNLLEVGELDDYDVQFADGNTRKMYGMSFFYEAYGNKLWMYRMVGEWNGELVTFTAKYIDGEQWSQDKAMEALEIAIIYFELTDINQTAKATPTPKGGSGNPWTGKNDTDIRVVQSEASKIKYSKYDNGLFSAEVPKGWTVDVHDKADYIHYTFQIYNPDNPDIRIFFNMKTEGYWASQEDKDYYSSYYPTSELASMPVINPHTTEAFYNVFYDFMEDTSLFKFRRLKNVTQVESLGKDVLGGQIIHATGTNTSGGKVEGVFACTLMPVSLYYVTAMYVYNTYTLTAPEGELSTWMPVLEHIFASIEFSEEYQRQLSNELRTISQAQLEIGRICSQTTDIVISGWESRQATYDRISQKQSDATLGYERVYDTEKGEVYRAPLDFFDNYSGDRYKPVTDDQYLLPIDGYLEWK